MDAIRDGLETIPQTHAGYAMRTTLLATVRLAQTIAHTGFGLEVVFQPVGNPDIGVHEGRDRCALAGMPVLRVQEIGSKCLKVSAMRVSGAK